MVDLDIDRAKLRDPKTRNLLIAAAVGLVLLILIAVWFGNGTERAKHDLRGANDHVVDKQREVNEARALLEQRLAELRQAKAEADAQGARLNAEITKDVRARP